MTKVNIHGVHRVEAPLQLPDDKILRPAIFLAGGITGCPNWQRDAVQQLSLMRWSGTVFDPRRFNFPIHDPSAADEQIAWEHLHLRRADVVLFWFPSCDEGVVQPIAMFELGVWSTRANNRLDSGMRYGSDRAQISVGCDPDFARAKDVHVQMALQKIDVHDTLTDTLEYAVHLTHWSR